MIEDARKDIFAIKDRAILEQTYLNLYNVPPDATSKDLQFKK